MTPGDVLSGLRRVLIPPRSTRQRWLQRFVLGPVRSLSAPGPSSGEAEAHRRARRQLRGRDVGASERPHILYLLHDAEGGVAWTHRDLMSGVCRRWECFVLFGSLHRLSLYRFDAESREPMLLRTWWHRRAWSHGRFRDPSYADIYEQIVERLGIDLVHVRHLLGHTLDVLDLCAAREMPLVMSFHDYYMACPSIHLLDDHGKYCGGTCTPGLGQCRLPIDWLHDLPILKSGPLVEWRGAVASALPQGARYITTSESARDVMTKVYPRLDIQVIEHGRDFPAARESIARPPSPGGVARILVAGHIGYHKGGDYLRRLVELDRSSGRQRFEVHVLGTADAEVGRWATCHGAYSRDEFPRRAAELKPTFAGVFSVWPETYSHTLTEAWSLGLPVLACDLGAVAERIRHRGGGWLLPVDDVEAAYERIVGVLENPDEYRARAEEAQVEGLPSVDKMVKGYLDAYDAIGTERARSSEQDSSRRVL